MYLQLDQLPSDLIELASIKFNKLVDEGKIIWEASTPQIIHSDGFMFQFRIVPHLSNKPILSADAPGRTKAISPFIDPDPNFVVAQIGAHHTLEFGMYSVSQYSFILHTNEYEMQTNDLNKYDLAAAWMALTHIKPAQMMIYNCGVNAGSSQGHKHMQIFSRPDPAEFKLFPDSALVDGELPLSLPNVPYKHFLAPIPATAGVSQIHAIYQRLLEWTRAVLKEVPGGSDYNVVLVHDWMLLIPRRFAGFKGNGANAAGMLGMVWVQDQWERNRWTKLGYIKYLSMLGVPA